MSDPVASHLPLSDRPSYLAKIDEALFSRHELSDAITAAFHSSHDRIPDYAKKQLTALRQCGSAEQFLATESLTPMLPMLLHFRSSGNARFLPLLRSYIAVQSIKRKGLVRSWTYPLILVTMLFAVLLAQAWIISPVFEDMFTDFDLRLPFLTSYLFWINRLVRKFLPMVIILAPLLLISIVFMRNLIRRLLERFQHWRTIHWLTSGSNANLLAMYQFVGSLAACIEIGMPLSDALRLAGEASQRSFYRNSARLLNPSHKAELPEKVWSRFPAMLQYVVQSNVLDAGKVEALYGLSELYRDRALLRKQKSHSAVQPFVILAIGALIGFIAITLFMPLFSLITALS